MYGLRAPQDPPTKYSLFCVKFKKEPTTAVATTRQVLILIVCHRQCCFCLRF